MKTHTQRVKILQLPYFESVSKGLAGLPSQRELDGKSYFKKFILTFPAIENKCKTTGRQMYFDYSYKEFFFRRKSRISVEPYIFVRPSLFSNKVSSTDGFILIAL